MNMTVINENNKLYPIRLKEIKEHPKALYCLGNINLLNKISVAIVGSRKCDNYGLEQTKIFASYLAERDICIVSGLAKGIDTIAHRYSKDKKGKTIAVIASGFNHIYPKENIKLVREIIKQGGLVISEWKENIAVQTYRFPKRNRIISGLSVGTLVVEATEKSGSMITAHYAMKQNRDVFCIPGNLDKERSRGTNKLISEGANLVISPEDIINILQYDGLIK